MPMADPRTVTVRPTRNLAGYPQGKTQTVPLTARVQTLIARGRLIVIPDPPSAPKSGIGAADAVILITPGPEPVAPFAAVEDPPKRRRAADPDPVIDPMSGE